MRQMDELTGSEEVAVCGEVEGKEIRTSLNSPLVPSNVPYYVTTT
jgi:hypothetical protein